MKYLFFCLTVIFLMLSCAPVHAEGLSTTVTSVHSGQFPAINVHLKIYSKEPMALAKEHFTLSEDDQSVKDFTVTIDKPKQYYILTIDRSSSIKQDMPVIKQAVLEFLKSIPPEVIIGVVSFASDVQLEHEFSSDRGSIYKSVRKIRAWGGTALYDSIYEAVDRLSRVASRSDQKTIVCLTDGEDSNPRGTGPMSVKTLKEVTEYASKNSTRIISIGLGREIDEKALKSLARKSKGAYLRAPTAVQLKRAYLAISRRAKLERYYAGSINGVRLH